jgi:hypothetical protein
MAAVTAKAPKRIEPRMTGICLTPTLDTSTVENFE